MCVFGCCRRTPFGVVVIINHHWFASPRGARSVFVVVRENLQKRHLGGGELGHGLGALGDGVLGELTGEDEAHGGLDLAGGHGGLLVVAGELGRLGGDLLEDVVDEGVHDGHSLGGDAGVGVHLLEDLVDVDLVGLGLGLLGAALAALGDGLLGGLLGGGSLGHCVCCLRRVSESGVSADAPEAFVRKLSPTGRNLARIL